MGITRVMRSRRVARVVLTLVGALALHGAVAASASAATGFQDPSKNIRCAVKGSAVTCIILRQDKAKCAKLFTASGSLKQSGPSVMNFGCFTAAPFSAKRFTTLKYGKRKTLKGVTCVASRSTGMKCTNRAKHGFTLSRKGSTSF
jgi:hypothetical protein